MKPKVIYVWMGILSLILLATAIGVVYEVSGKAQAARVARPWYLNPAWTWVVR